jgi:sec-independent protein translocase protein TatC
VSRIPLWDHVEELRKAIIRCGWTILAASLLAFCFHKPLFALFITPLGFEKFVLLSPLEGFFSAAKLSFWVGFVLSSPLWLYFLLSFFLPALNRKEKKLLFPFFLCSAIFIFIGIFFAYTVTLPLTFNFLKNFNASLGENLWSLSKSLDLVLSLLLAHGLIFELYVVLLFLVRVNLCSYELLQKARRGVIVAVFILAAILTPPDVLSQLLLALPMLLLYESALIYARYRKHI